MEQHTFNKLWKNSFIVFLLFSTIVIVSCGGGSTSTSSSQPPAPPASKIPDTKAVTPIPPLIAVAPEPAPMVVTQAILRVVHRNTISGILSPNGDYIDSDNATVEKRGSLGLYFEVTRETDNRYRIEPENNGLAYFRVITTKSNGSKRVHNFYGVKPGFYMTFDTTDVAFQKPENPLTLCKKVDIRLLNLPTTGSDSIISINGFNLSNPLIEQSKGFVQGINLCPIDLELHYLALVVIENSESDIRYGFNFYQNLQENDFLEVDLAYQADIIPWQSNHEIGNDFQLYGFQNGWSKYELLYSSPKRNNTAGTFPEFSQLALSTFRFISDSTNLDSGINMFTRELAADVSQVDFAINNMEFTDLSLNPLDLSWLNVGVDQPEVITGLIFNSSLKQSYAFMSMDDSVLSSGKFDFPLDDVPLLVDSLLFSVTGAAGINNTDYNYISEAALFSGFLYWPDETVNVTVNSDVFISANGSEILQFILDNKL